MSRVSKGVVPNEMALAPVVNVLSRSAAARFNAGRTADLEWAAEKRYALAILSDPNNSYLLSAARENPASLVDAMLDASRLGLSLSPALKHAYLIPSSTKGVKRVNLMPSYIGMEQSVLRSGKITVIQTDLVYENDDFKRWTDSTGAHFLHTPARKDRGELEGAYCLAKFGNGEHHLEYMDADDLSAVESAMLRQNNGKTTPAWRHFKSEMQKKAVVRRGAKHWPRDHHLNTVIDVMDRSDPMDFGDPSEHDSEPGVCLTPEEVEAIEAKLDRVPESQRGVWVMRCSEAMGFPGGPTTVTVDKSEDLVARLIDRMNKVYGEPDEEVEDA